MGYLLCAMWVLVMAGVGGWWFGVCGLLKFPFLCVFFASILSGSSVPPALYDLL